MPYSKRLIGRVTVIFLISTFSILFYRNNGVKADHNPKTVNEYFDKRIPDEETHLTDADFIHHDNGKRHNRHRKDLYRELDQEFLFNRMHDTNNSEEDVDDSAMYNGNRFEGDIVNPGLSSKTLSAFIEDANGMFVRQIDGNSAAAAEAERLSAETKLGSNGQHIMRNAVRQAYLKWPNGRIPYTISKQYTVAGRQRIADAFKEYKEQSCIEFTPKTATDLDYVHILPDEGCYSLVGKVGGKQPISLGNGCMHKGIIIHELMHSVGFFHEQSRADRDEYIKIKWENVEKGLEDQFDKYSLAMIDHLGTKYDYGSVMHYGAAAFSRNGMPTIETVEKDVRIGQRIGFSATDLYKINKLYACPNLNTIKVSAHLAATVPTLQTVFSIAEGGAATVSILPGTAAPSPAACADLRADCATLAARGHCESIFSSAFMSANCVKSCERCDESDGGADPSSSAIAECRDRRTWCPGWAASGLCDFHVFQQYMHAKCAYSCGLCK